MNKPFNVKSKMDKLELSLAKESDLRVVKNMIICNKTKGIMNFQIQSVVILREKSKGQLFTMPNDLYSIFILYLLIKDYL